MQGDSNTEHSIPVRLPIRTVSKDWDLNETNQYIWRSIHENVSPQNVIGFMQAMTASTTTQQTELLDEQHHVPVNREVKWVKVAERWTRISVMTNSSGSPLHPVDEHEEDSINFLMIPGMLPQL